MPIACAAIPILPESSVPRATPSPLPSSPSRSSSGTKTLSSSTSSVVAEMTPIFLACLPKEMPSASIPTTKAVTPSGARAKTTIAPATLPFVTTDTVATIDSLGAGVYRGGVGTGLRLGEGEAPDLLSASEAWHPPRFLFFVTVHHDGQRPGARVDREGDSGTGVGAADLLQEKHVGQKVRPRAAVLLRHAQPHKAHLGQLLERLRREPILPVQFAGKRRHLPVGELRCSFFYLPLLLAEFKVHKPSVRKCLGLTTHKDDSTSSPYLAPSPR